MSRLKTIPLEEMDTEQRALFDVISEGRRAATHSGNFMNADGGLHGPFDPYLRAPELGMVAQRLGELIRYETSLADDIRELAILVCARHWRANFEWSVHEKTAIEAGLPQAVIENIMQETEPTEPEYRAVYRFIHTLNATTRVNDKDYQAVLELYQERGLTELIMLSGYYALVAQIVNVFDIPVPDGSLPPFRL